MIVFLDECGCASIFSFLNTCAVAIEPNQTPIKGVRDSKKLSKKQREELYPVIAEQVEFAFGSVSPATIEKMNLHYAKYHAMTRAINKLVKRGIVVDKVFVDGKFTIPNLNYPQEAVVKGDDKLWACSCASILGKVYRDRVIAKLGEIEKYSHYDLENNAGYFSPLHRDGIIKWGLTNIHRKHFDYTKYCFLAHLKSKEFNSVEDYFIWRTEQETRTGKSDFQLYKEGMYDVWKEVKNEQT